MMMVDEEEERSNSPQENLANCLTSSELENMKHDGLLWGYYCGIDCGTEHKKGRIDKKLIKRNNKSLDDFTESDIIPL